jgi:hypothetical protein
VNSHADEARYVCQATKHFEATKPLVWWDPRQYLFDIISRNHSVGQVLRVLWLALLRRLPAHVPFGYRVAVSLSDWMHRKLAGRPGPSRNGKIARGQPTPSGRLDLRPGEYVRVKSQAQIEETINEKGLNRGLSFYPEEMAPFCGRVYKVRSCVTQIIEELTGTMLRMKQPCIVLEGVVCSGAYASGRLNCPRAIPVYWRELWLERVSNEAAACAAEKGRDVAADSACGRTAGIYDRHSHPSCPRQQPARNGALQSIS